ncbi:MAG TPA: septum formation initiator family protein [Candidatus Portnoybacteria bacterium]|nr:septum formation initiator family protein [Candidatus Portnoybacteria bacterium]
MEENKFKKFFSSRVVLFLLLLAFVWLSLVLAKAFYKKRQMDQEISSLKTEIEKMDKKGQELNQLLSYFNSQSYLEKEAKDKLNLKKEGESVVMVQGVSSEELAASENVGNLSIEAAVSEQVEDNNLVKWWKFFFKR